MMSDVSLEVLGMVQFGFCGRIGRIAKEKEMEAKKKVGQVT